MEYNKHILNKYADFATCYYNISNIIHCNKHNFFKMEIFIEIIVDAETITHRA